MGWFYLKIRTYILGNQINFHVSFNTCRLVNLNLFLQNITQHFAPGLYRSIGDDWPVHLCVILSKFKGL